MLLLLVTVIIVITIVITVVSLASFLFSLFLTISSSDKTGFYFNKPNNFLSILGSVIKLFPCINIFNDGLIVMSYKQRQ